MGTTRAETGALTRRYGDLGVRFRQLPVLGKLSQSFSDNIRGQGAGIGNRAIGTAANPGTVTELIFDDRHALFNHQNFIVVVKQVILRSPVQRIRQVNLKKGELSGEICRQLLKQISSQGPGATRGNDGIRGTLLV